MGQRRTLTGKRRQKAIGRNGGFRNWVHFYGLIENENFIGVFAHSLSHTRSSYYALSQMQLFVCLALRVTNVLSCMRSPWFELHLTG
jgi:hypothetical protein